MSVDINSPLRYGLQSAFDGNPATSYVENTEDDLMNIEIIGLNNSLQVNKIALINGYAANQSFYQYNNRIKEFNTTNVIKIGNKFEVIQNNPRKIHTVRDKELIYQLFDLIFLQTFYVTDIYQGERYNDTCLAELNVKTNSGWLFEEIENE